MTVTKKTLKNVNICMPRAALKLNTVGTSGAPQDVEMETCMFEKNPRPPNKKTKAKTNKKNALR